MINPLNRLIYTLTLSVILAAVLWAGVAQWRLQQAQKQAAAAELADAKAEIARLSGSLQIESQRAAAYRHAAETLNTALQQQQAQHSAAAAKLETANKANPAWSDTPLPDAVKHALESVP